MESSIRQPSSVPLADPAQARTVFRYFDLADSFVQVRVTDTETLCLPAAPTLDRAGYRKLVIETCMPEFSQDLAETLETLFPEDPLMVENLLYDLCVEVNPTLDIHEVNLRVDAEASARTATAPEAESGMDDEHLDVLARKAFHLERRLKEHVIGQDAAVQAVVRSVRKAAVGLAPEGRPVASLLFAGRTGTGKTELARRFPRALYREDGHTRLVRSDCSEFALAHEYSKLIGSPPGYVGHEDGGRLTDAVAAKGACVVLFDEIEKAHPRMHNLLLQVLEEGALTDGKGRTVSFAKTIVLLTSNVGAEEMVRQARAVGFGGDATLDDKALGSITQEALERDFSPEMLGRIDEVITFGELERPSVDRIAQLHLTDLAQRLRRRGFTVAFTPAVARWVSQRGFSPASGAREIRRVLQREIEPALSDLLLERPPGANELLRVRIREGQLALDVEGRAR